ncbi:MAG: hypothetical protein ACAF41_19880 [Leptolyngbya sp. BL-A-14]
MRQSSRVESSTPSSLATGLHPVLSITLANLDIQLEDELVRYRRHRTGTRRGVPQAGRKSSSHQLDLISVAATATQSSAAAPSSPALDERLTNVTEPTIAPDIYKPTPAFTAQPQPFDAAIALRNEHLAIDTGAADPATRPAGGNDVHALAHPQPPGLDDYLESSEELLRSLADEQAEVQAERSFMKSLLTPLGLGSMLLLLLSSAMFGYVIMNPSSMGWLAQRHPSTGASLGQGSGTVGLAPQPDLAKRELPELNLNNLGTVNVSPGSSSVSTATQAASASAKKPTDTTAKPSTVDRPSTTAAPASTQAPIPAVTSDSSRASSAQLVRPQPATAPSRPTPSRSIVPSRTAAVAPVRPAPVANPSSTASNNEASTSSYQYKVGIPFENDQTLENARKVVPDAFVRTLPDGRTIVQVGAARSESEVKASMQGLRDRGLPSAEVYKR